MSKNYNASNPAEALAIIQALPEFSGAGSKIRAARRKPGGNPERSKSAPNLGTCAGRFGSPLEDSGVPWNLRPNPESFGASPEDSERRAMNPRHVPSFRALHEPSEDPFPLPRAAPGFRGTLEGSATRRNLRRDARTFGETPEDSGARRKALGRSSIFCRRLVFPRGATPSYMYITMYHIHYLCQEH